MIITQKTIYEISDRLRWDDCWGKELKIIEQKDLSLNDILQEACQLVECAELIILPWEIGIKLLRQNQKEWPLTLYGKELLFSRNLETEKQGLLEMGYIGDFMKIPVVATCLFGGWLDNWCAYVTSTSTPKDIKYDETNLVVVRLNHLA